MKSSDETANPVSLATEIPVRPSGLPELSPCPPFSPAWWCPGPHLQTLWPTLVRRKPRVRIVRERLDLPDGDFLDLD